MPLPSLESPNPRQPSGYPLCVHWSSRKVLGSPWSQKLQLKTYFSTIMVSKRELFPPSLFTKSRKCAFPSMKAVVSVVWPCRYQHLIALGLDNNFYMHNEVVRFLDCRENYEKVVSCELKKSFFGKDSTGFCQFPLHFLQNQENVLFLPWKSL